MDCRKSCLSGCGCISLVLSTVFAAAVGILFFLQMIPNVVTAIWISFGLGLMSLSILIAGLFGGPSYPCGMMSRCLCAQGKCLLVGSMGTIVCALAALSTVLSSRLILTVFLVAVDAFFTGLMLFALFSILMCLLYALCGEPK